MVQRAQVEVTRLIPRLGGGAPLLVGLKEEKFQLRPDIKGIKAHVPGPLDHPAQHAPGVAHKGGPVGVVHIADKPGHLALGGAPGEDGEAVEVGVQVLVRLIHPGKALDGGAVEHDLVIDRLFDLVGRDGHVFQLAENIHKLHADKFDLFLLHDADDVFLGIAHNAAPFPRRGLFYCDSTPLAAFLSSFFHFPRFSLSKISTSCFFFLWKLCVFPVLKSACFRSILCVTRIGFGWRPHSRAAGM